MKSQTEEQKTTETKKPRFKIEKLEERIAPKKICYSRTGCYKQNNGSGGHCGHGACK